jgi:hypothetical protein
VRFVVAVALSALVACGVERDAPRERQREERPEERPEPPPPDPAHAGVRCELGEGVPVLSGLPRAHHLGVAASDTATLVAIDRDPETLLAIATRVASGARAIEVPIAGADTLFALEALDGDRFVAITRARCPADLEEPRCLVARLIGADGRAIGEAVPLDLPRPLRTVRATASGDAVWIARTHEGVAPRLDRLGATESGLEARTLGLGEGLDLSEEPTEILGVAIAGGSWAVLWRHGATEDARSGVVLSTQLDEHEVDPLHDALVLHSFQWYAGALSLVAAFEFARPRWVRLGADGEVRGEIRTLPPDEPLPAPFTTRRTAVIVGGGPTAAIEIRDGAGDAIGEPIRLGSDRYAFADVARRGDAFVVAIATLEPDGIALTTRDIHCR